MNGNSVQSVDRALSILEAFSPQVRELGIAEISEAVGLARPTVSRLVTTLCQRGYLAQNQHNRKYRLGVKLLYLGNVVRDAMDVVVVARPVLREINQQYGETAYIDIYDGEERLCVETFEGTQNLRTVVPVGQRAPLYAGSDSRVLLAGKPDSWIRAYLTKTPLVPFTENTIIDPQRLQEEIERIRREGVAVSWSECTQGSVGISSPIFDHEGKTIAALSMSLPQARATAAIVEEYKRVVKQAALRVSEGLGYSISSG